MDQRGHLAMDGASLKRGIQTGDARALSALHDAHVRPLYSFCFFRLGRDHHAAEEVVQETLLLALERIDEWEPDRGDLDTWLAWLSRNLIRRANEARRRFAGGLVEPASLDPELDDALDEGEAVTVALERLPGHYRSVLERKYLQGESVRAIASSQQTTEKAVESLLGRARDAFRSVFLGLSKKKTESVQ